jgi:hypothetical protein
MKKLENWFKRGKKSLYIWYKLMDRTDRAVIFKLFVKESWMKDYKHVGWEVTSIVQYKEREIHGHIVLAHEGIVGDEYFGNEGSKAF